MVYEDEFRTSLPRPVNGIAVNPRSPSSLPSPRPAGRFIPRDQLTVPVCMAGAVSDGVLFEAAEDETQKYYLPRYRLATWRLSGKEQYRIALEGADEGEGGRLVVYLARYPAAEIEDQALGAEIVPHQVTVELVYRLTEKETGEILKRLPFQEITAEPDGLRAVLRVGTLGEVTQLFRAMTGEAYRTELVINRVIQTALPLDPPVPAAESYPNLSPPHLVITRREDFTVGEQIWTRVRLAITNRHIYHDELFLPAPDLPPCGLNHNASRTWVDIYTGEGWRQYGFCALGNPRSLGNLWVAFPQNRPAAQSFYVTLTDRAYNLVYRSNTVAILGSEPASGAALFRPVEESLVNNDSFVFPESIHGYIYRDVSSAPGGQTGFISRVVSWKEQTHVYLQEKGPDFIFYYLPDQFKLARLNTVPYYPWLTLRFSQAADGQFQVGMSYRAVPYVNKARIEAAAAALRPYVSEAPAGRLSFFPLKLAANQLALRLAVPGDDSVGFPLRPEALVSLQEIRDELPPLSIKEFQTVYEALFRRDGHDDILVGHVEVNLGGQSVPPVPFALALDDLVGDLFVVERAVDEANGGIRLTLRNAIESPIRINSLRATLRQGETESPADIRELDMPPNDVGAGEAISFLVVPTAAVTDLATAEVVLDRSGIEVRPDQAAIYDAIVDPTVTADYQTSFLVTTFSQVFEPPDADNAIKSIKVNFFDVTGRAVHGSVTLQPDERQIKPYVLQIPAELSLPIREYVLGQANFGQYRYQLEVTTVEQTRIIEVAEPDSGDLFISKGDVAIQ